jgi:hypothetical protein
VLEIRHQLLGTLDAYDFALIPYKTEIGNRAVICENLIGIFWHGSKDAAPRPFSQTKLLVDNVFCPHSRGAVLVPEPVPFSARRGCGKM